ncbi:MAG: cell division protein ZapA [Lachnospiraceae bacterium]|nr:cell division protein ZapA [Lachnospiraceae bacterium]
MESRQYTEVLIGGNLYRLSGMENEEYMQQVAIYLNGKLSELKRTEGFTRLPADYQSVMIQLNIADDYFKAKEQLNNLAHELEEREKELYQVKHDLITTQLKMEAASRETAAGIDPDGHRDFIVLNRPES